MLIGLITFYVLFSLAIGLGILKDEQLLNQTNKIDIFSMFVYPLVWPYFFGILISKVLNSDAVFTVKFPNKEELYDNLDEETTQEDTEE